MTYKLSNELVTLAARLSWFMSIVHSFIIAGRGSAYSGPQRWDLMLVQCASPGEKGNWLLYANVCMACRVKEGLSRSEQLVKYFYSAPLQEWPTVWLSPDWHLFSTSHRNLPHLSASAHVSTANTLKLLIKASATVTVESSFSCQGSSPCLSCA